MKRHVFIVLAMILSLVPMAQGQEELCMDGELLFREDFGGNAPSAPRVGTQAVTGMSYYQLTDDYFGIMMSGSYLLTKSGYCNGDTSVYNPGTRDGLPLQRVLTPLMSSNRQGQTLISQCKLWDAGIKLSYAISPNTPQKHKSHPCMCLH